MTLSLSLCFSLSASSSILHECLRCQTMILSLERGSKSRLSSHNELQRFQIYHTKPFSSYRTLCFRPTIFSSCCCAMLLHAALDLLVKSIQTWAWVGLTLALCALKRQLWLTLNAQKKMGVGRCTEKRMMKKKKERLKMCEDIYPKITVLIYFNSMSYFKTKAEKML